MTALVPEDDDGSGLGNVRATMRGSARDECSFVCRGSCASEVRSVLVACVHSAQPSWCVHAIGSMVLEQSCDHPWVARQGRGETMEHHSFKSLKSMRLWSSSIEDAGAGALAHLLLTGPPLEVGLTHLEIMDDSIGPAACRALGDSLVLGGNSTLMTLRLDLNRGIGDDGIGELCKGLRTNRVLSKLTLSYCGVTTVGATALAHLLASPASVRTLLRVVMVIVIALTDDGAAEHDGARPTRQRTRIRGIACALVRCQDTQEARDAVPCRQCHRRSALSSDATLLEAGGTMLVTVIFVCYPWQASTEVNQEALHMLGAALMAPEDACKLAKVDLEMNALAPADARVLVEYLPPENKKVVSFKVDTSLPADVFDALVRVDSGKKAKGKGGKKGKKK